MVGKTQHAESRKIVRGVEILPLLTKRVLHVDFLGEELQTSFYRSLKLDRL